LVITSPPTSTSVARSAVAVGALRPHASASGEEERRERGGHHRSPTIPKIPAPRPVDTWPVVRAPACYDAPMNPAEVATSLLIEKTLASSPAYRKVDDSLYVIKQGSAYVMINVVPWGNDRACLRCTAQLVKGITVDGKLALELLELNTYLRFGASPTTRSRTPAVRPLDPRRRHPRPDELTATLRDVALIADEYDDKLVKKYGGQRMLDLLEEAAIENLMDKHPDKFDLD
jgi:hypothetical protein